MFLRIKSSSGQMKIQQMAFVLVAIIIFFAMALIVFVSIYFSSLQDDVIDIREQEVKETARKISGAPEFAFTSSGDCASCVDFDKVFVLKDQSAYQDFWRGIPFLEISKVSGSSVECNPSNYPNCDKVTIIEPQGNFISHSSFVSLCYFESDEKYFKCELGRVIMGFDTLT